MNTQCFYSAYWRRVQSKHKIIKDKNYFWVNNLAWTFSEQYTCISWVNKFHLWRIPTFMNHQIERIIKWLLLESTEQNESILSFSTTNTDQKKNKDYFVQNFIQPICDSKCGKYVLSLLIYISLLLLNCIRYLIEAPLN